MNTIPKLPFRGQGQTISITVSGKVQGVYYRQSTKEKALELGITGQVKNLPGGNVFITATGTNEQLDKLVEWCNVGPSRAVVTSVIINKEELQQFGQFRILK